MSKKYPCVHFEKGLCKLFTDDTTISYCLRSPCKQQQLSNADRIRAMSDKEMAKFLANIAVGEACVFFCENPKRTVVCWECKRCIAEWLKQPAEDTK